MTFDHRPECVLAPVGIGFDGRLVDQLQPWTGRPLVVRRDQAEGDSYLSPPAATETVVASLAEVLSAEGRAALRTIVAHPFPVYLPRGVVEQHLFYGDVVYNCSDGPELSLELMELRNEVLKITGLPQLVSATGHADRPEATLSANNWLYVFHLLPLLVASARHNVWGISLPVFHLQWPTCVAAAALLEARSASPRTRFVDLGEPADLALLAPTDQSVQSGGSATTAVLAPVAQRSGHLAISTFQLSVTTPIALEGELFGLRLIDD